MISKVCRACGRDVSNERRVRDRTGQYYCEGCHLRRPQPTAKEAPGHGGRSTESQAINEDDLVTLDDLVAVADAGSSSASQPAPPTMSCTGCGGYFDYIHLQNIGGKAYCVQCFASKKLKATMPAMQQFRSSAMSRIARGGIPGLFADEDTLVSPEQMRLTTNGPATVKSVTQRLLMLVGLAVLLLVIGIAVVVVVIFNGSPVDDSPAAVAARKHSEEANSASQVPTPDSSASNVPAIRVTGDDQHILTFREWKRDAMGVLGVMTCSAPTMIESIKFSAKRNGIVKDRGELTIVGGEIRKDEPVQVRMNIGDLFEKDRSGYDVTIEVQE